MEAKPEPVKKVENDEPKRFKCKVYRLNVEKENADLPISVNLVGRKKREFAPGEEVVLYDYHIGILRNAVNETELTIPAESGIYQHSNPMAKAEDAYPGFRASRSEVDGTIKLVRRIPMYSVEVLREV